MDEKAVISSFEIDLPKYRTEIFEKFDDIFDNGYLVLGKFTKMLEEKWAEDHSRGFGVAVNSDTAALDCCLSVCGIKDEMVLIPQMAFFGVVNVVLKLGGIPVLVDVTMSNGIMPTFEQWCDALDWVVKTFGRKPKVAMFVYSGGMAGSDTIRSIEMFREEGIRTIEDCAHCAGARYGDGRRVGSAGDFATWSFYTTKLLSSGEGGIIVSDSEEDVKRMRNYRAYGRKSSDGVFSECSDILGYNWRITEFQAAILNVMWSHIEELIGERKRVAAVYDKYFPSRSEDDDSGTPFKLIPEGNGTVNLYRYMVIVPGMSFNDNIWLYKKLLDLKPVGIRLQEKCNHLPVANMAGYQGVPTVISVRRSCPGAIKFSREHICLPIYPNLSSDNAEYIAKSVVKLIEEMRRIGRKI